MRTCTRCGVAQPLSEFYAKKGTPSGLDPRCKACGRAYARRRREEGLVQALERARYHASAKKRATVAANTKRWKQRNPEKLRAEAIVDREVRGGRLVRQPCETCGDKAHAHHADYSKPLEVQWLCPWHHARQHVAEGRLDHLRVAS